MSQRPTGHLSGQVFHKGSRTGQGRELTRPTVPAAQCSQEGIIAHIYNNIAPGKKYLIDLGAGDGFNLSNSRYFLETGWMGLLVDGMEPPGAGVTKAWITLESVPGLLKGHEACGGPHDYRGWPEWS